MPSCSVRGCKNRQRSKSEASAGIKRIRFFGFPKNGRLEEWIAATGRENVNVKTARICSAHFAPECFRRNWIEETYGLQSRVTRVLLDGAVPTLQLSWDVQHPEDLPDSTDSQSFPSPTDETKPKNRADTSTAPADLGKIVRRLSELDEENARLKQQLKDSIPRVELHRLLGRAFTPGQINLLLHPDKKFIRWSQEDVSSAIALRSISTKTYRYLRSKRGYPLPGLSTLRRWVRAIDFQPGVLGCVLDVMKFKALSMSRREKLVVLSFGEMTLSSRVEIDKKSRQRIGPHASGLCVVARGLFARWKQPVYYSYDEPLSSGDLLRIVGELQRVGFTVVAVVTGIGDSDVRLWQELDVGERCFFAHPTLPLQRIFVFADAAQLLNLIREHLDAGHVEGYDSREASEVARIVGDWLDVFASTADPDGNAYGRNLDQQNAILARMTELVSGSVGSQAELPVQRSVLLNNDSLPQLFAYLQQHDGSCRHLPTVRLNRDVVDQLLLFLRTMAATGDQPSAADFRYRLRWYILGKRSDENETNCNEKPDELLTCDLNLLLRP